MDDESKLHKAIKKRDKAKKKSRKAWADRNLSVEEAKAARQAQRAANLAARKKAAKKPTLRRPGFEGGRGFLPNPKAQGQGKSFKPGRRAPVTIRPGQS